MNTSDRSQTPSHSMNERLWNDVNLLDNISDWNCGLDYQEIFHHPPHQSQKMSITTNADEVITLSATDLVCEISSFSVMQGICIQKLTRILSQGHSQSLTQHG